MGCRSENCSNNGVCIEGQCRCFQNYTGSDCNEQIQTSAFSSVAALSSTICSSHGEFDYTARRCKCESGWSGSDCSRNDNCLDKACTVCRNGFGGLFCLDRTPLRCDPRCNEHGVCMNGTCTCSPGYHGRHCDISKIKTGILKKIINKTVEYRNRKKTIYVWLKRVSLEYIKLIIQRFSITIKLLYCNLEIFIKKTRLMSEKLQLKWPMRAYLKHTPLSMRV